MQIDRSCGFNAPPYLSDFSVKYSSENKCRNPARHALILDSKIRFLCEKHKIHYVRLVFETENKAWVCPKSLDSHNTKRVLNEYRTVTL